MMLSMWLKTTGNSTMGIWGGLGPVVGTLGGEMVGIFRLAVLTIVFGVGFGAIWDFASVAGHHGKNGSMK